MNCADFVYEAVDRTDVGRVRTLNEDRVLARTDAGLWMVADGMGGHQRGDLAATMLVDALAAVEAMDSGFAFLDGVQDTVQRVNRTLVSHARLSAPGTVIGSTVVVLLAYAGHYACLWAGDSRGYLLRGGRLDQITRDHSMVQEMLDSGALSRSEVGAFGRSNVITRAVGVSDRLALEVHTGPIAPGDIFLLCSDGLTGMIDDATIAATLSTSATLDAAADDLMALALDRGARDNVSLVLIRTDKAADDTLQRVR